MKMQATASFHDTIAWQNLAIDPGERWVVQRRTDRRTDHAFATHYHPYTDELIEKLNREGLPALLDADWQASLTVPLAPAVYQPGPYATGDFPSHEIDVSDTGAYSIYNWELFFHAPVLVATHLSKNQRFE